MTRARTGFTLVEALVVVLLIGLLVALLMPALRGARQTARDSACLSNHRQLMAAWTMYTDDYEGFPVGDTPDYWQRLHGGWGGVHWYDGDYTLGLGLPAERPVNPYLLADRRTEYRAAIFRCPADFGGALTRTGLRTWDDNGVLGHSGEGAETAFGASGTSYAANSWMYCEIGAENGFYRPPGSAGPPLTYRPAQGPQHVVCSPSRFVVLADYGQTWCGRISSVARISRDAWAGWWHGEEYGQMSFLDGSARRELMGAPTRSAYTFFLDPTEHGPSGWFRPESP